MKLLPYTLRKLSIWLLLFMAVWGALFYFTIIDEVMDETDDTLENYAQLIINEALADPEVLHTERNLMSLYYFHPISTTEGENFRDMFYDSFVYREIEEEEEPVRVLRTAFCMPTGQYYELEIMISTLERDDMVYAILWYIGALFLLFLVCVTLGTRAILHKVFQPLNRLVVWLQQLHPGTEVPPLDNPTDIREFRVLTDAAADMAQRSRKAYEEQKRFIENASHELQTPLAIAMGKLELLAEQENLSEKNLKELDAIYSTLGRAVKLNKSLLLLSRIENGQYAETEKVSIDRIIDDLLPDLMEVYEHKRIQLRRQMQPDAPFIVRCNPALAHILVTNLIKNGMVHNRENGSLTITTTATTLVVANSGEQPLDSNLLFQRFAHSVDRKKDSTGLGLAIAYSIACSSGLALSYGWEEGMHVFMLSRR